MRAEQVLLVVTDRMQGGESGKHLRTDHHSVSSYSTYSTLLTSFMDRHWNLGFYEALHLQSRVPNSFGLV